MVYSGQKRFTFAGVIIGFSSVLSFNRSVIAVIACAVLCFAAICSPLIAGEQAEPSKDNLLSSCRVCHGQSNDWIKGRSTILKNWSSANKSGVPSSHLWLDPELVKKVASHKLAVEGKQISVEGSYFSRLNKLKTKTMKSEPDASGKDEWKSIITEGEKLAPGYQVVFWDPARAVLESGSNIRGHLVRIAKTLMKPYASVLLIPGQKAVYEQIYDTGVKGVAFVKGSSSTYNNELTYAITGSEGKNVKVDLVLSDTENDNTVTADFLIAANGEVSNFVSEPPNHMRAENFAKRWVKPKTDHLYKFTTEHILTIPPMAGREVEPVTIVYDVEIKGIVNVVKTDDIEFKSKVPLLHGTATLKQKKGEHMGIRGTVNFFSMPIGLTAYSDVKMRFKKKVSAFMVQGSSRDRMKIIPEKSVIHPHLKK